MTVRVGRRLVVALVVSTLASAGCNGSSAIEEVDVADEGVRIEYGDHADAFGELWLPAPSAATPRVPVVVLIHGGFWRDGFFLDLMNPLIPSLLERGVAVWNIEYRRVGAGGGYPATFEDVAAAIDQLGEMPDEVASSIDLDRVAVVGHSAGGHLAVWATARSGLPSGEIGADPVVKPVVAVSQAGVLDLIGCAQQGVGGSACSDLIGAQPAAEPERYAATSPAEMVPFDASVVAVHGAVDRIVPSSQSVTFVDRARAADMDATFVPIADADHFSNLDPEHPAWSAVIDALDAAL